MLVDELLSVIDNPVVIKPEDPLTGGSSDISPDPVDEEVTLLNLGPVSSSSSEDESRFSNEGAKICTLPVEDRLVIL